MSSIEQPCPECGTARHGNGVCEACGAPAPVAGGEHRSEEEAGIRTTDLEPYVTLRYIAKLFKVLAVIMVLAMIGEVATGLIMVGSASIVDLIGGVTRFLVLAGLLWAAGDLAILLVDLGHDIRVSRILLGRINSELHRRGRDESEPEKEERRRA